MEIADKKTLARLLSCNHLVNCGLVDVGDQGEPKQKRCCEQDNRASQEGVAPTPSSMRDTNLHYHFRLIVMICYSIHAWYIFGITSI